MLFEIPRLQVSVPGQAVISPMLSKPAKARLIASNSLYKADKADCGTKRSKNPWLRVMRRSSEEYFLTMSENNLTVFEFTPLEVKMAMTGYGRAEKDQVRKMVLAILKMNDSKKLDDEIDAIAIALTCPNNQKNAGLNRR